MKNPQRNVPLATWGSIAIPMVVYTLLQVAFIGAMNWKDMGLSPGQWHLLQTSSWADGPFLHALDSAGIAALTALGSLLLIDAAVSPLATGWVYLGTATRTGYGLGVHRNIPPVFQSNNRFGIPWVALVVSGVVGCVFFVPAPSWYQLVGFISAAAVLTYIMGGILGPGECVHGHVHRAAAVHLVLRVEARLAVQTGRRRARSRVLRRLGLDRAGRRMGAHHQRGPTGGRLVVRHVPRRVRDRAPGLLRPPLGVLQHRGARTWRRRHGCSG